MLQFEIWQGKKLGVEAENPLGFPAMGPLPTFSAFSIFSSLAVLETRLNFEHLQLLFVISCWAQGIKDASFFSSLHRNKVNSTSFNSEVRIIPLI